MQGARRGRRQRPRLHPGKAGRPEGRRRNGGLAARLMESPLVEPLVAHLLAEMPERRAWEREFPRGDPAARRLGFNLPARFVLHTVGPVVADGRPGEAQREALASCYRSCRQACRPQ
ncbi:MAG: macro domain-containing protein, partial [Kiritimatiellae bacterium]|nr:macro domain-containing protein [Kiritimatiellia bacterium]